MTPKVTQRLMPIFFLLTTILLVSGQPMRLSPSSQISLITCGPSDVELYSAFGHSAIRVYDPLANIDWAFNYGTFDFNQPNFYLNFTRGRNMYMLSVQDYQAFRDYYIRNDRYLHEQILHLSQLQRQRLFEFLWNNAQPENKSYPYDYFYDNCSTRPRDVLVTVFGDSLTFDNQLKPKGLTIRQLTDLYLRRQPWGDLGIDLCLGLPMDKLASAQEEMFLPDFLENGMDHAQIRTAEGKKSFVSEKIIVHKSDGSTTGNNFFHPWIVLGLVALIILLKTWIDFKNNQRTVWIDHGIFLTTGLLGGLLSLLWLVTDHRAAAWNFNILWAFPLNVIAPYLLRDKNLNRYYMIIAILGSVLVFGWFWMPQQMNQFLLPIVFSITVRYWYLVRLSSNYQR